MLQVLFSNNHLIFTHWGEPKVQVKARVPTCSGASS